ncbi:hypothetical protein ACLB2K_020991 [Fragaria x ananassa]
MKGAFATKQGNCSSFKSDTLHSCVKDPEILDLMPDSSPENMSVGCCRGGLLDAWAINPSESFSSFEIKVGNLQQNSFGTAPLNLTLMAPGLGYTCGPLLDADPTVSLDIGGKRQVQVFNEVALFWGIPYVNTELISTNEDQVGSVSTDMLLKKDLDSFTFSNGWAFPRRLYFNGESCQMPLPDSFPTLPNAAVSNFAKSSHCLFLLLTFLTSQALLVPWL